MAATATLDRSLQVASHSHERLGGSPLNPQRPGRGPGGTGHSADAEREYERLRSLARDEHGAMQSCFSRAQQAYATHDPAAAHSLSTEGHAHQAAAASYNVQASSLILTANNAGLPSDVLDLHGQFVDEATAILETRITAARAQGVGGRLHVVVGRGVHSVGHVQRIKPAVEEICRKEGLAFGTEANEGRVWVDLGGQSQGQAHYGQGPETYGGNHGLPQQQQQYQQSPHQQQQYQQPQYLQPQQQDMHYNTPQQIFDQGGQQQGPQNAQGQEDTTSSCLKMLRGCCSVM